MKIMLQWNQVRIAFPFWKVGMARLFLSFLGPFSVRLGDQPITRFESDKVRALLAYLAVEAGKPHRRSALAGLLWSEYPEQAARASLRNVLADLRQTIKDQEAEPPYLLIERETIQFNLDSDQCLDVHAFEELLAQADQPVDPEFAQSKIDHLKTAVSLYRGSFLQGFSLRNSLAFEEWLLLESENLNRKAVSAYAILTQEFERREDYEQACTYAFRLVQLEPWHEEAHRQLMRLLALNGQSTAAQAQYEAYRRNLRAELNIEPDSETVRLYEQIRAGKITGATRLKPPLHNLPAMLSKLIGRESELHTLLLKLEDPSCRLLTLVGPGGCGKTRLAIEAAYQQLDRFKHGVHFVTLAGIQTPQAIPQAAGQALDLSFRPEGEPWGQILDYVRQKQILLILDNFEHLLEGVGLVMELLHTAPGLKILVTSRVRLNSMEEHLFPLEGLGYPEKSPTEITLSRIKNYSAVQLFLEGAQRVKPEFTPEAEDWSQIGAICRLVDGMPLAVLLSASWAGMLSPEDIAAQIRRRSLDFLETEWKDVPERHRSLRHVFEHSWNLLSKDQQRTLAGLSVFQGSFSLEAVEAVTGIELKMLRELVDHSMVQTVSAERFDLHMLMRQFAADRLEKLPDAEEECHNKHCAYFLEMLVRWAIALQGPGQGEAQREIAVESENIRTAWEWALEHGQYDRMAQSLDGLGGMYERLCLYQAGEQILQSSIISLKAKLTSGTEEKFDSSLARMSGWLCFFNRMLGKNEAARQAIDAGMEQLESLRVQNEYFRLAKAFLLQQSGLLSYITDAERSQQELLESLALFRSVGNPWCEAQVLTSLASVSNSFGQYFQAQNYLKESLAIQRLLGDTAGLADTLIEMGTSLASFGDFDTMAKVVQEHALITREFGNPSKLGDNLLSESVNLCYLGQFAESARRMEEAISIFESLGSQSRCMILRNLLGWIELNGGQFDQGFKNIQLSSIMGRHLGDSRINAVNLLGLGEAQTVRGEYVQARQLLEESIHLYRQVHQEDELSLALVELADIELRLGLSQQARSHFHEALQIAAETGSWQANLFMVGKMAFYLTMQDEVEKGVEIYALATRYPYVGNSCYWEVTTGKHIIELAAGLPEEVASAAKERGKQRDLHATVKELLKMFEPA